MAAVLRYSAGVHVPLDSCGTRTEPEATTPFPYGFRER